MKIHEYQAKELLRQHGVPVPRGYPAFSVREAEEAAQRLGGSLWVVKAQIHAGGRGKGGGVKLARSAAELTQLATQILGMQLVTHQTGPQGQKVRRLLVEEGADIRKEYYVAVLTDRATQKVCVMASSEGGMDIEQVAHDTPEKILKVFVEPSVGLTEAQAQQQARKVVTGKYNFAALGRAMAALETDGFVKVVADAETHEVLGIHVVGPAATDLISEGALALEMGAFLPDLALTVHPHPTLSEAIREAAAAAIGEAVHIINR